MRNRTEDRGHGPDHDAVGSIAPRKAGRTRKGRKEEPPESERATENDSPPTPPVGPPEIRAVVFMVMLFVVTVGASLLISPIFGNMGMQAFSRETASNPLIAVVYLVAMVGFTGVLLLIIKFKKLIILKFIVLGSVFGTMCYVLIPVLALVLNPMPVYHWTHADGAGGNVSCVTALDLDGQGDEVLAVGMDTGWIYIYDTDTLELLDSSQAFTGRDITALKPVRMDGSAPVFLGVVTSDRSGRSSLALMDPDLTVVHDVPAGMGPPGAVCGSGGTLFVANDSSVIIEHWSLPNTTMSTIDLATTGLANITGMAASSDELLLISGSGFRVIPISGDPVHPVVPVNDTMNAWLTDTDGDGSDEVLVLGRNNDLSLFEAGGKHIRTEGLGVNASCAWLGDGLHGLGKDELVYSSGGSVLIRYSGGGRAFGDIYDMGQGVGRTHDGTDDMVIVAARGSDTGSDYPVRVLTISHDDSGWMLHSSPIPSTYMVFAPSTALFLGAFISLAITAVLFFYPEWYVVDAAGILMGVGAMGIIGISLSMLPVLCIMVLFAIYDAISVYKTKHMLSLADAVLKLSLPIILVAPKTLRYSFREEQGITRRPGNGGRQAMFVGLGDIIIPGMLVISAFSFLPAGTFLGMSAPLVVALGSFLGTMMGFTVLMFFVLRGKPQAGLPLLNSGTIVFYLLSYMIVYQDLTFGLTIIPALPF